MGLNGAQTAKLRDAMLSGFNDPELEQFVRIKLNENLHELVEGGPRSKVVFDLITWAERKGRVIELIRAVQEALPKRPEIQNVTRELLQEVPRPAPLASPFQWLIDAKTANFVGRDYVFQAIDAAIADPKFRSGYIVVRGEPGIGKTALLAQLVKTRGYVHHFNIRSARLNTPDEFIRQVCAQLNARYELDQPPLPSGSIANSRILIEHLTEAVGRAPDKKLVVLVDALDEADLDSTAGGANRLYLPNTLPNGVNVVVTTRPEDDLRLTAGSQTDIYLKDTDPQNIADVTRYIRNYLTANATEMGPRIRAWGTSEDDFIKALVDRSEGNFQYLVYILADIRTGELTKDTIDRIEHLPVGLDGYYKLHWRLMEERAGARFEHQHKPIVCLLGVVREPVTPAMLAEWTKRWAPVSEPQVIEVLRDWLQFLNEEGGRYRIYHASFGDFLHKKVSLAEYDARITEVAFAKIRRPNTSARGPRTRPAAKKRPGKGPRGS
jgi:hypothetical protein